MRAFAGINGLAMVTSLLLASCTPSKEGLPAEKPMLEARDKILSDLGIKRTVGWEPLKPSPHAEGYPSYTVGWRALPTTRSEVDVYLSNRDATIIHVSNLTESDLAAQYFIGQSRPKAEILAIAESWVRKWVPRGMENVVLKDVTYIEDTNRWLILWQRKEGEILFRSGQTWVVIRAYDGSLQNFKREMFAQMPDNTQGVAFSQAVAVEKARAHALNLWEKWSKRKWSETSGTLKVDSVEVLAVHPNADAWLERMQWPAPQPGGPTRLAYVVEVRTEFPSSLPFRVYSFRMEVWIDHKTGEILGFEAAGGIRLPSEQPPQ